VVYVAVLVIEGQIPHTLNKSKNKTSHHTLLYVMLSWPHMQLKHIHNAAITVQLGRCAFELVNSLAAFVQKNTVKQVSS
jgi:hypothetical protein